MSELSIWKNQEIRQLRKDMRRSLRRFCECFGVPPSLIDAGEVFDYEMLETDEALVFTARIPGLISENLSVSVTDTQLLLKGKLMEAAVERGPLYQRVSRRAGAFSRVFALPVRVDVEAVEATLKDERLTIVMPRAKSKKPDRIRIDIS